MTMISVGFLDSLLSSEEANTRIISEKTGDQPLGHLYRASHLYNDATFDPLTL
jgi:hypothetical protein